MEDFNLDDELQYDENGEVIDTSMRKLNESLKNFKPKEITNEESIMYFLNDEDLTLEEKTEMFYSNIMNDFEFFLTYVFHYINLPEPSKVQKRLAKILCGQPERHIINAHRAFGKSIITGVYATWRLLRDVNEKILIVSGNSTKANEISSFARRLLDLVPILNHLVPQDDMRDAVVSFDVAGCEVTIAPSVKVAGIFGSYTGSRATLVIADDIETPENSATQEMREKLLAKSEEFEALNVPNKHFSIIYLGTPQSAESIYSTRGNNLGSKYNRTIIPLEVPEDVDLYEGDLDEIVYTMGKAGSPVHPELFPIKKINEKKAGYSTAGYRLQFMLDTTLSDAEKYPLKLKHLTTLYVDADEAPAVVKHTNDLDYKVHEFINVGFNGDGFYKSPKISEKLLPYDFKIMSIDSSGTGSDETACAVIGVLNGNIFLLDSFGTTDGASDKTLMNIAKKAKEHEVSEIIIEKNFSGGVFTSLLEKFITHVYPCTITEVNSTGQKEKRIIETLEPIMKNNKLFISNKVVTEDLELFKQGIGRGDYSLFYQMTHITYDRNSIKHDDRLDALTIACSFVSDAVLLSDEDELANLLKREKQDMINQKFFSKNRSNYGSFLSNYN